MSALQPLENSLDDLLVKKAPPLPPNGKKALVEYLPWINLVFGLITLYTAWALWHWAHVASGLIDYANDLSARYSGSSVAIDRMGIGIWIGLIVLSLSAILYLAAFQATRQRKKSGWDLMFYAILLNVAYGVVIVFSSYGGIGNLLATIIGAAIGLYLLFQIRASYLQQPTTPTTPKPPVS